MAAKQPKTVGEVVAEQKAAEAAAQTEGPTAPPPERDDYDPAKEALVEEKEALSRELAHVKARLAELQARQAQAPAPHAPGRYRVKLEGAKVRLVTYTVRPHRFAPKDVKEHAPAKHYDTAGLLRSSTSREGQDLQRAAWDAYRDEVGCPDEERQHFDVLAEVQGLPQDHLDVFANSPADAFEAFKRYNGITRTERAWEARLITDGPEEGQAA